MRSKDSTGERAGRGEGEKGGEKGGGVKGTSDCCFKSVTGFISKLTPCSCHLYPAPFHTDCAGPGQGEQLGAAPSPQALERDLRLVGRVSNRMPGLSSNPVRVWARHALGHLSI